MHSRRREEGKEKEKENEQGRKGKTKRRGSDTKEERNRKRQMIQVEEKGMKGKLWSKMKMANKKENFETRQTSKRKKEIVCGREKARVSECVREREREREREIEKKSKI